MAQSDAAAERSALHTHVETDDGPILERDGVAILRVVQELRDEVVRLTEALHRVEMSLLGVGRYKDAFMMPALVERCKEAANHAAVGLGKRKAFPEVGK